MADLYTEVADQQNAYLNTTAERQADGAKVSGDVLFATAKYTLTGSEVDTDVIKIVKLPEGATVIPHLSHIYCAFGTTVDMDLSIGDDDDTTAVDPDRYSVLQAVDAVGAGTEAFGFSHETAAAGLDEYKLQKNSWIEALVGGLKQTCGVLARRSPSRSPTRRKAKADLQPLGAVGTTPIEGTGV